MAKAQRSSAPSPASDRDPPAPRGLSRSEKSEFVRICRLRREAGKPISPIEVDLVVDYLHARERLQVLQRVEWSEQRAGHFFIKNRIALAASIDRAAGTVRRLARDLKLVG